MKLKYNLIAWSLLGFFAAACDPMDDIYNEIDAEGTTNTQTMAEYVLTDADYETISSAAAKAATSDAEKALANAVKTDKALNEFASAEKYVPSIIAKMLPSWGKGSCRNASWRSRGTVDILEELHTGIHHVFHFFYRNAPSLGRLRPFAQNEE